MIKQREHESRVTYLLRVASEYIENNPEFRIEYDETVCDGYCLSGELSDVAECLYEVDKLEQRYLIEV